MTTHNKNVPIPDELWKRVMIKGIGENITGATALINTALQYWVDSDLPQENPAPTGEGVTMEEHQALCQLAK